MITNKKSTKRALLSSVLALLLCMTMLIGSTYAWFTDSVTSGVNRIVAGNLDVELYYNNAAEDWTNVEGVTDPDFFKDVNGDSILWEPGAVAYANFKVANEGTLALKYALKTIADDFNTIDGKSLADALTVKVIAGEANYQTREQAITAAKTATDDLKTFEATGSLAPNGAAAVFTVVIYWAPGATDNDFNVNNTKATSDGEPLWIDIELQLTATQDTVEEDSFDELYDEEAVYGTYVELNAGDDLLAAMAAAEAGKPLTIKLNGNVDWPTTGHHGENDITPATSIVINGNGYAITATGAGVTPLGDVEAPMTLKNVKIIDKTVSYKESAWEFSYLEMGGTELVCANVTFADPISVESDNAIFTDCSFIGYEDTVNSINMNGVWMANGDATCKNCTFTGARGMKICDMYAPEVGTVVIDGCTFMDLTQKPGVAIDDCDEQDMDITIKNSTFINCQPGDQGLYIYETDNTVPTVENNVVESYTELVEIDTKEELVAFANRVNGGDGMSGVLVKLTADIDLAGMEWTPIGQTGTTYGATNYFQGIFDGQDHTISNMTISQTNAGKNYAAGFFGFVDGAAVTVRNVNFDKANVTGHHWTGVVAGYLTGNIEKCNVTNSTVVCTHANDDACGDKAGAIVGYINNGLVNNCTASDTTVSAGRDAGQIVGASKPAYVANCSATNVTVSAGGDCTGANIRNEVIGRLL